MSIKLNNENMSIVLEIMDIVNNAELRLLTVDYCSMNGMTINHSKGWTILFKDGVIFYNRDDKTINIELRFLRKKLIKYIKEAKNEKTN